MRASSAVSCIAAAALAGSSIVAAAPYQPFPLSDGFPSPSASQLATIQKLAGGSLPGGALPTKLSAAATVTLQLIALNEIFEVAFFNDLLANVTSGTYDLSGYDKNFVVKALTTIKNVSPCHI